MNTACSESAITRIINGERKDVLPKTARQQVLLVTEVSLSEFQFRYTIKKFESFVPS